MKPSKNSKPKLNKFNFINLLETYKKMVQSNKFEMNSDLSEVKVLANHFRVFCSDNQQDEKFSSLLELVLVEALNNIVIHTYENISGFKISAQFSICNSQVIITLIDNGKTFEQENNLQNKPQNKIGTKTKDLAEGNWGLELMNSIADEINRHRENDSNILTIKKSIDS